MKHKHAEFIKAWADDPESVQVRLLQLRDWCNVRFSGCFDETHVEFRHTPKPDCWYSFVTNGPIEGDVLRIHKSRFSGCNLRLTYIDGMLTAAEVITEGDGK